MATQPNGPSGTWTLVWDDEFDDTVGMSGPTNGLATSHWNVGWQTGPTSPGVGNVTAVTNPASSLEAAYYGPASIVFPGDGALHIRAQAGVDNGGSLNGRVMETALISTAGLMALNPATVAVSASSPDLRPYVINGPCVLEIQARFPGPNGQAGSYWPGLWMINAGHYSGGGSWPEGNNVRQEIDLIEFYVFGSIGANGRFHFHSGSSYGGMSSVPTSMQSTDLSLAYHTYTYQFTQTTLSLWVDGIAVTGITPDTIQIAAQWHDPMYLLLSFGVVAGATIPTTANNTPSDCMIDYVRVWNAPVTTAPVFSSFGAHA